MNTDFQSNQPTPDPTQAQPSSSPYIRQTPKPVFDRARKRDPILAEGKIPGFGHWKLDDQHVLHIHGKGRMPNWDLQHPAPWTYCLSHIETVELSTSITSIGDYAFYQCQFITYFPIEGHITSIGKCAFKNCHRFYWGSALRTGLLSIGEEAFSDCYELQKVLFDVGPNITHIGDRAFQHCANLWEVEIPSSVTYLGKGAFEGCEDITQVYMPFSLIRPFFKRYYGFRHAIVSFRR